MRSQAHTLGPLLAWTDNFQDLDPLGSGSIRYTLGSPAVAQLRLTYTIKDINTNDCLGAQVVLVES